MMFIYLFICPVLVCFYPLAFFRFPLCLFVCVCLAFPCMVVLPLPNGDVIRDVSCLSGCCPSPTRALDFDKDWVGHDGMGWDAVSTHPSTPLVVTK